MTERAARRVMETAHSSGMGTMGRPHTRTGSGSAPSSPAHSVDSSGNLSGTSRSAASEVKVVVRVRPLNANELARGEEEMVCVSRDQRSLRAGNRTFDFNACLSPDTIEKRKNLGKMRRASGGTCSSAFTRSVLCDDA